MRGLIDWIQIGVGAALGALVAGSIFYAVGHWRGVDEGRAQERTASLQRSMDAIKDRNDTNAKVNDLGDAGLCAALGGRWVSGNNVCE